MKRTEIIELLTKELQQYESCKLDKKVASELLGFIEELGMLPPEYTTFEGCYEIPLNKWEPE